MSRTDQTLGAHGTAWIAVLMAWCAGFVDIVSYTQLQGIYTSHMTGNTASLANHLLRRDGSAARFGWAILCFLFGLVVSASLTHAERRKGIRRAFAASLVMEIVLLGIFIWLGVNPGRSWRILMFLPCAAMGLQTVTVTRVGQLRVYTTYLTGSLAKLAEALTEYGFWLWESARDEPVVRLLLATPKQRSAQQAAVTFGLWIAFFLGACCGAMAVGSWGRVVLALPMSLLGVTVAIDLYCPVALGDTNRDETD